MRVLTLTLTLLMTSVAAWAHPGSAPNLRHWETASADPDRIFLSFMGDVAPSPISTGNRRDRRWLTRTPRSRLSR